MPGQMVELRRGARPAQLGDVLAWGGDGWEPQASGPRAFGTTHVHTPTVPTIQMGHIRSPNFVSGSAGWEIRETGDAEFNDVTIRGTIYATAGSIGGWTISADNIAKNNATLHSDGYLSLGTGDDIVRLDAQDDDWRIWVGDATAGDAPFRVDKYGGVWATDITAQGSIRATVFEKSMVSCHAGTLVVVKSAGKLYGDYTVGGNLELEDPPGGGWLFDDGDIVLVKEEYQGSVYTTWITVYRTGTENYYTTDYESGVTPHTYKEGAVAVDYGQSGDGGVEITADGSNAPHLKVFSHAGEPWDTTTEHVRLGNLNGLADYESDEYGIFVGDYSGDKWLAYDPTNSLRIRGDALIEGTVTADKLAIGNMLFSEAQGLLLLGPFGEISATAWYSPRGQKATLSGGFHQEAGRWIGTRALVVEEATTNLITNPSFETNTTGWAGTGGSSIAKSTDEAFKGSASCKITNTDASGYAYITVVNNPTQADDYAASMWVKGSANSVGETAAIQLYESGGAQGAQYSSGSVTLTREWQKVEVTHTVLQSDRTKLYVFVVLYDSADTHYMYFDAVQCEQQAYLTSYCDGSLGSGYAWTGTAHNSTSTRTATEVNLDERVGLISGNDTVSLRVVMQMGYDADARWPRGSGYNYLLTGYGAGGAWIIVAYDETDDKFSLYLNGAERCQSSAQTFAAGDWVDLVVTLDFGNDSYIIYVDGEADGSDTTALTAPAVTEWNLGSSQAGTFVAGCAYAELAAFDKVLSAAEVAQLYNLQRPLVDAGAQDTPGIYVLDGKFKVASSSSGNRIEMDADEIAGYNSSGTKQFYLQASDGAAMAGAGAIVLNAAGFEVHTTGEQNIYSKWYNSQITTYTSCFGFGNLQLTDPASHTYGSMNFGVRHDANNQSGIACWLNQVDVTIQKAGSWRTVLNCNYDKIWIESVPLRVGTGTADPATGIEDGMIFYRTDTHKFRGRVNGAWVNLN